MAHDGTKRRATACPATNDEATPYRIEYRQTACSPENATRQREQDAQPAIEHLGVEQVKCLDTLCTAITVPGRAARGQAAGAHQPAAKAGA
jgi:hypothetical protein